MTRAIAPRNTATQELPTDPEASPDTLPPASGFAVIDEAVPDTVPADTIPAPPWVDEPADVPDSAAG
jgi:hypothetical protein